MEPLEHGLLFRRQVGDDAVEEEGGLVQQPLGGLDIFEDDALGHRLELRLLLGGQILAGEDDHGHVRQGRLGVHFLQQLEASHVGQPQVEHHAVEGLVEHRLQRLVAGGDGHHLDVFIAEQLDDGLPLDVVVLDDQQPLGARGGEVLDAVERRFQALGGGRLDEVGEGAVREAVLAFFFQGDDLHRDVPRGRVELELVEHRPAEHVGQEDIERDGRGVELPGEGEAQRAFRGDDALEALVARQARRMRA